MPATVAGRLTLRTLGHACLALYRGGERPLLLTDPWLVGSVYWRSWWLQNYPSDTELDWLAGAGFAYVTHEHPDHFHMPSIRRLGRGPRYLFPRLSEPGYRAYMASEGYDVELVPPATWRRIADGVSILSIPTWNDDSLLLIDTPRALILNLNDAKPLKPVLRAIERLARRIAKPRVLLCSYSPASLVNSFIDDSGILSMKKPENYVAYVSQLADRLGADFYLPFASQAEFDRDDSQWANDYRTSFADLERFWRARARLLPPYTTLDLEDFSHQSLAPEQYQARAPARIATLTRQRMAEEEAAPIAPADLVGLERKLNAFRWLFRFLFPRGFSWALGNRCFRYDAKPGRLVETDPAGTERGDFVIAVPKLTLHEAIENNHLSDLGITMFVRIRLLRPLDMRKVYGIFVLFGFDDYGHFKSLGAFCRWLGAGLKHSLTLRLPQPPAAK